jgi:hypothetical protein
MSELRNVEDKLDLWLISGAERFRRDPELMGALLTLARHDHTRECVLLLEAILETPGLMPRLMEVLRTEKQRSRETEKQRSRETEKQRSGTEKKTRRGGKVGARR